MESLLFPLDSPPFRRANFHKFRPCKAGSQSFYPTKYSGPARCVKGEDKPASERGERQLWGGNEEGRSGRAGALRTGERRQEEQQRYSLALSRSLSLSSPQYNTPPPSPPDRLRDDLGTSVSSDTHRWWEELLYGGWLMPQPGRSSSNAGKTQYTLISQHC